jgi:hypothetical protein
VPEPLPVELSFDGPTFEYAVKLAREAATSVIHGGPAATGGLEFVLTASANDRVLGATVLFLLSTMTGNLACHIAELEDGTGVNSDEENAEHAEQLVDEFLLELTSVGPEDGGPGTHSAGNRGLAH